MLVFLKRFDPVLHEGDVTVDSEKQVVKLMFPPVLPSLRPDTQQRPLFTWLGSFPALSPGTTAEGSPVETGGREERSRSEVRLVPKLRLDASLCVLMRVEAVGGARNAAPVSWRQV